MEDHFGPLKRGHNDSLESSSKGKGSKHKRLKFFPNCYSENATGHEKPVELVRQKSIEVLKNAFELKKLDTDQEQVEKQPREGMHIEHIQPERQYFFRSFEVASIFDFSRLAKEFYNALNTRPSEWVYCQLQRLQGEKKAINALNDAYNKKLRDALEERFWRSDDAAKLEYACQLIKEGNPDAKEAIQHEPLLLDDFTNVAWRINQALHDNEPEVVYAALTPFQRNTELLYIFRRTL